MWIPATKWLVSQGCVFRREFQAPWGICDLVGLEWEQARVADRRIRRQNRQIGPPLSVAVLQLVPDETSKSSITVEALSARLGEPVEVIERNLMSLARSRFVKRHGDASFTSSIPWAPLHRRIIAIELKLDRVGEAIAQARSHIAFATASFVGFPDVVAQRIVPTKRARELVEAGVGLLSVSAAGTRVLVQPSVNPSVRTDPVLQMYSVERFWPLVTSKIA
jgi:hypothetical protein